MDYKKARTYWEEKDRTGKKAPEELIQGTAEKFILSHKTCALATGFGNFIRCTPIEYNYYKGCFWFLSEGGKKFYALENNANVCIAIYNEYTGFSDINGMQIQGKAEMIEPFCDEYNELLAYKKIPIEKMKNMKVTMYLIKVTPSEINFMSSEFRKAGYEYRQKIIY